MSLSSQLHIPMQVPLAHSQMPGALNQSAQSHGPKISSDSKVEHDLSQAGNRSSQYPEASAEEVINREKRASKKKLGSHSGGPSKSSNPTKPALPNKSSTPPNSKAPKSKTHNKSNGPAGTRDNAQKLNDLHNKNAFTPISSQLAITARNSFISAGVSTLINLPFSVAEYVGSKAIADRIDAHSKMPGAETKNADGTKTTVDPAASEQQKIEARLEGAEINTELMANTILSINEGPDAKAVGKNPNAATDTSGRLAGLEQRMDAIEDQMQEIAKRYGLVYSPYAAPESSETPTDKSRMDGVESRYIHMNKMVKKLIAAKMIDSEDE